jgi:hypothetical protein
VDEARLGERARWFVRLAFLAAVILLSAAFFLSVLDPAATEPNALIFLACGVAVLLVVAMLTLGTGLVRHDGASDRDPAHETRPPTDDRRARRAARAPAHAVLHAGTGAHLAARIGGVALLHRMDTAMRKFVVAGPWLRIVEHLGPDALQDVYGTVVAGRALPEDAHIVRPA